MFTFGEKKWTTKNKTVRTNELKRAVAKNRAAAQRKATIEKAFQKYLIVVDLILIFILLNDYLGQI